MTVRTTDGINSTLPYLLVVLLLSLPTVQCKFKYSSKYNVQELTQNIEARKKALQNDTKIDDRYLDSGAFFQTKDETFSEKVIMNREKNWPLKIYDCVENRGLIDCLKIFLLRRMDRVNELIEGSDSDSDVSIVFDDLKEEIQEDFKWEKYNHLKEGDLDSQILQTVQGLIEKKRLKLVLRSGMIIDVIPDKNGNVKLGFRMDPDMQLPRGMKLQKTFYRIVPMLLIPPLIMSAILPFVLPALKLMIIGVGMLNQIALTGAIFTLLRNNIFDDKYEKKVIYVNHGYKNEKKAPPLVHRQKYHTSIFTKPPTKPKETHQEFDNSYYSGHNFDETYFQNEEADYSPPSLTSHYDGKSKKRFNSPVQELNHHLSGNNHQSSQFNDETDVWEQHPSFSDEYFRRKEQFPFMESAGFTRKAPYKKRSVTILSDRG